MPPSVHLKRHTESVKSFGIRTYTKRGEGEGPRSTTRLNTKAARPHHTPASAVLLIFRLAPDEPSFQYVFIAQPQILDIGEPANLYLPKALRTSGRSKSRPCAHTLKTVRVIVVSAVQSTHPHNSIYVALLPDRLRSQRHPHVRPR